MKDAVMNLPVENLMLAYVFTLLLVIIYVKLGIRREKLLIVATLRMSIQLTIMGYMLMAVFSHPSPLLSLAMVAMMLAVAVYNAVKRVKIAMSPALKRTLAASLIAGYGVAAAIFIEVVLRVRPWFDPQYFIPISGMIIGNAMTGLALAANALTSSFRQDQATLENALMLGATPRRAAADAIGKAFDSATLPTINNMMTMGLVSLPGMMTGQLLSGTYPLTAIKYQIGIMLAILGCTGLSTVIFVLTGYRTFFTRSQALRPQDHQQ